MQPIIDAHIHFDQYTLKEQQGIMKEMEHYQIHSLISVSTNLSSAVENLALYQKDERIKPSFGYHPEQPLPTDEELADLIQFMDKNHQAMVAIGEVGLPYYTNVKSLEGYLALLEEFFKLAVKWNKPVALHAIYEDAPIVINLLEKYSIQKAHFHWFKGDTKTIQQMVENGYFISFTPDLAYEHEIQKIAATYPLSLTMVETDGPWPFEGPFQGQKTHPKMIHETIRYLAKIKSTHVDEVYRQLYNNTILFYSIF